MSIESKKRPKSFNQNRLPAVTPIQTTLNDANFTAIKARNQCTTAQRRFRSFKITTES